MNRWVWLRANVISNDSVPKLYSLTKVLKGNQILINGLRENNNKEQMINIEKLAFQEYCEAAKLGNNVAFSILGFFYENGLAGLKVDYSTAEKFYTESLNNNKKIGLSLVRLGFLKHYGRPNIIINQVFSNRCKTQAKSLGPEIALAWLKQIAEYGHISALFLLASSYYNGLGVEKDQDKAFQYAKISAMNGNSGAQNLIGMIYFEGTKKIQANEDLALFWYKKAANLNEAAALYNIAMLYENGTAVSQNYNEAFNYYRRSSELGSVSGTNIIGFFYEHGIGTEVSKMYAFSNYYKAALQGSPFGQYNVGRCFLNGIGVEEDINRAIKWFECSGNQGHGNAYLTLAVLYDYGILVNMNKKIAKKWYHKAYINKMNKVGKKLIPEVALDVLKIARSLVITKNKNTFYKQNKKNSSEYSLNDITYNNSIDNLYSLSQEMNEKLTTSSLEYQTGNNLKNLELKFPQSINCTTTSTTTTAITTTTETTDLGNSSSLTYNFSVDTLVDFNKDDINEEIKFHNNTKHIDSYNNDIYSTITKLNKFNNLENMKKNNSKTLPQEILYNIIDIYNTNNVLSVKIMSKIIKYISERPIPNNTKSDFYKYIGIEEFSINDNKNESNEDRVNNLLSQFRE